MGQLKRQILMWGAIATTTAVLPGLALAGNVGPDHEGGPHGREDAGLSVAGRAFSRGTTDSYGLQIRGRSGEEPTEAGGRIRFGHKGSDTIEGFMGEITCLSKDANGVVNVSGTVVRSGKHTKSDKPGQDTAFLDELLAEDGAEPARHGRGDGDRWGDRWGDRGRRGRGELAGKDFALTIDVPAKPQKFSVPTIGDPGSLAACSGGGTAVEVTRGRFRTRDGGGDGDGEHERGRRGWWRR